MSNSFKTNLARILLLLSVVVTGPSINVFGQNIFGFINIQLILIFTLRICSPSTNFKNIWFLSIVSLINDSLTGLIFGTTGILYLIVLSVASFQASIKLRSIFISEWIAFSVAMVLAYAMLILLEYLSGVNFAIAPLVLNYLFTVIAYPLFWFPLARGIYA